MAAAPPPLAEDEPDRMAERAAPPEEAGRMATELPDRHGALALGMRGEERRPFSRLAGWRLESGDVIVYFTSDPGCEEG
jgi:hypothetical protein